MCAFIPPVGGGDAKTRRLGKDVTENQRESLALQGGEDVKTEALWIWPFGLAEALGRGLEGVVTFLTGGEWLLALVIPLAVFVLGFIAAYSYLVDRNPVSAALAGGFLVAFYVTEVVFAGRFEYAILYLGAMPVVALFAAAGHLLSPRRRSAVAN